MHLDLNVNSSTDNCGCVVDGGNTMVGMLWQEFEYNYNNINYYVIIIIIIIIIIIYN